MKKLFNKDKIPKKSYFINSKDQNPKTIETRLKLEDKTEIDEHQNYNLSADEITKIASYVTNNKLFIDYITTAIENRVLEVLENRYDLTPTDKLRQLVNDKQSELDRINLAIEEKGDKLIIIKGKLEDMSKKAVDMFQDMCSKMVEETINKDPKK